MQLQSDLGLIWAFVFANAKIVFSHDAVQIKNCPLVVDGVVDITLVLKAKKNEEGQTQVTEIREIAFA